MIITVSNQKGGTGKSTTAAAIATGAAYKGKKTLAIDLDPQSNLSFIMGANPLDVGAYELMTQKSTPAQLIQHTSQGDVIAGSLNLAGADTTLKGDARVYALKTAIKPLKSRYDVIVIDTPPTLGTLLINALTAADKVIIPLQADILSLQGLYQLTQTIRKAQSEYNKGLEIAGILFTRHSNRTLIAREIIETMESKAAELNVPILKSTIRDGVAVREAQTLRQSLFEYAPKSKPAQDYFKLLAEIGL